MKQTFKICVNGVDTNVCQTLKLYVFSLECFDTILCCFDDEQNLNFFFSPKAVNLTMKINTLQECCFDEPPE